MTENEPRDAVKQNGPRDAVKQNGPRDVVRKNVKNLLYEKAGLMVARGAKKPQDKNVWGVVSYLIWVCRMWCFYEGAVSYLIWVFLFGGWWCVFWKSKSP